MFIKEICLEGFKSYAQRTVVPNLDPYFNAITGLNGSGKSNILDSICFVLGITKLEQVRASNLQELVYKQGQAGITKATVSVVFDNSDRNRSPIGYEDINEITVTRQIVVGGRNKYLINGHVAQPQRVQNLFHSVQLNVNNPHFLIMQGRITKVLNMKPPEILSMLEEAAGTRMYETKKEAALKTLEKKQTKVDEIDKMLEQEILPALEKLRKERAQYMQWANANAELERLNRFCIAFEFSEAERVKNAAVGEMEQFKSKLVELENYRQQLELEIAEKETSITKLTEEKEKQMGNEVTELSEKVDKLSNALVKETSGFTHHKESLNAEKLAVKQLVKAMKDLDDSVTEKEASVEKAEKEASELREKVDNLGKSLEDLEKEYEGVQAGKSGGNDAKSLAERLIDEKAEVGKAAAEAKQVKNKIQYLEKELPVKIKQLESKQQEAISFQKELQSRRAEVDRIKMAIENLAFDENHLQNLEQIRKGQIDALQALKSEVSDITGQLGGAQFTFTDPVKNFDRTKVKGIVARLIYVKDTSAVTALEVAAGGKIYNVIVDSEQTGKLLIEKGGLRRRVTIIPLNKIQSHTIPVRIQETAQKLVGPENAKPALSLVGYDEELKVAMEFVFGGAFVCKSLETAKEVAFHKDIHTASVTLDGDIFEPRGLLTGGSRRGGGELLRKLHALSIAESNLKIQEAKLSEVEKEIASLLPVQKKFSHLMSQLELKSYDLSLFENRVEQSEHHKLTEVVCGLEAELEAEKLNGISKEESYQAHIKAVADLEQAINEHGREREERLKALDRKIKSLKQQMSAATKDLKKHEGAKEKLAMEKEASVNERVLLEGQISSSQAQVEKLEDEVQLFASKVEAIKEEHSKAQDELRKSRARLKECDGQINALMKNQNNLQHKLTDCNVDAKKLSNEIKRMETDHHMCAETVDKLLKKHEWIATEKQLFGKPGTEYDFSHQDLRKARQDLESKRAEQNNVEKRINKKVMTMFEKAEDEYKDLLAKKSIIENDKSKIQKVIKELDEKKKEALKVTWQHVNKDFGSIFSTLLPGTMAKLDPPEGCDFLDGLEVRVAFGSVWKQSLSELSGGQRSLIALSLILALLLFKPAPLYILDEVDAALDLSHTQNIGRMIKAHFPHSQFIVVSLKEGMFNNANVIFRTKFVDGVSTVTRTVPRQANKDLSTAGNERLPLRENVL
ncbi:hypothetical protein O6H91_Y027600 [Diphasiastrum complanatum]|nr:hypothetical protein O6H91_Y027600 [Diphasiastrum complanatum]